MCGIMKISCLAISLSSLCRNTNFYWPTFRPPKITCIEVSLSVCIKNNAHCRFVVVQTGTFFYLEDEIGLSTFLMFYIYTRISMSICLNLISLNWQGEKEEKNIYGVGKSSWTVIRTILKHSKLKMQHSHLW